MPSDVTTLVTVHGGSVFDAPKKFGCPNRDGSVNIMIIPKRHYGLWIRVPTGTLAVATKLGRRIGMLSEGLHFLPFLYNVAFLVTKGHIFFDTAVKEVPTEDNVHIRIDVALRFHITDAEEFVYKLGPQKLQDIISATQRRIRAEPCTIYATYACV